MKIQGFEEKSDAVYQRLMELEHLLRESQDRLQAILDNSPTMIFLKDLEGRYPLSSRGSEKITHQPIKDIIGKTDADLFPPEQAAAFRTNDLSVLQAGVPMEFEEIALQDDGPTPASSTSFLYMIRRERYTRSAVSSRTSPTASGPRTR